MPRVIRVELLAGESTDHGWWQCFDVSALGRVAYERRWFEDFLSDWRRALAEERWRYRARLESVT